MVKYVSQDSSQVQKASSSGSEKGKNAGLEKSTNASIGRLVRKRLAARTRAQKNLQSKVRRCSQSFNSQLPGIMKHDQISCSICYETLVGPVLLSCGHFFCLHCLDKAIFRNGQCPLCRHEIGAENYKPSKQLMTLIDKFISYTLQDSEHKIYLKRVKDLQIIERKRTILKSLKVGDFVDLNVNQTWVPAKIKGIYNTYMTLQHIYKGQPVVLKVDVTSRRIANHYTFTKDPPLKPTYFTSDFNYHEPVLRYIVEPPSYTIRVPRRSQSNLVVDMIQERRDWDYFEPIRQSNEWLSQDPVLLPLELQGLTQLDENELLLGN